MARVSREDWLESGLLLLAEEGVEALTIDAMCQRLNVTKGSFYHHFKNRHAYLDAILAFWEDKYTRQFIDNSLQGLTPAERMARLSEQVIENYGEYEVKIRAWAQNDALAREYQERVDQQRLDFLYSVQNDMYDDPKLALTMAQLQYATLIGSAQMMPALSQNDLAAMYRLLSRFSSSLQSKDGT